MISTSLADFEVGVLEETATNLDRVQWERNMLPFYQIRHEDAAQVDEKTYHGIILSLKNETPMSIGNPSQFVHLSTIIGLFWA